MKLLVQKVKFAKVSVGGATTGEIDKGLLLFLGVGQEDADSYPAKIKYLVEKVTKLRIFADSQGKLNLSVLDVQGSALLVSQFTLCANCQKGNRPSFTSAACPELAEKVYTLFGQKLQEFLPTQFGKFGAKMSVELLNDGPVTIWLER